VCVCYIKKIIILSYFFLVEIEKKARKKTV
jgi:hypothetical protein